MALGSLATNFPRTYIAKILPFTFSTEFELNILPTPTCRSRANAATTGAKAGSTAGAGAGFFFAGAFFIARGIIRP